ncbi:MAG: glycosyltransferase family 4 protein, partial [Gammaproteobacteria bacterium]
RILVITPTYPQTVNTSGVPRFIRSLCTALADNDYLVDVIAPFYEGAKTFERFTNISIYRFRYASPGMHLKSDPANADSTLKINKVRRFWQPIFHFFLQRKIRKLLNTHTYAAIHAHWLTPQGFCVAKVCSALSLNIPIICSAHGQDLRNPENSSVRSARHLAMKQATLITVNSHAAKESLTSENRQLANNTDVLAMGTDLSSLFCRMPYVKRQKYALLFVGRLLPETGLDVLIRAMPLIQAQAPEVNLFVVGDGPERHNLTEQAKEYGCHQNIKFIGALAPPAIALFYNKARMLIVPNTPVNDSSDLIDEENMRQVCVEAMGCKCPVISAKLKPINEIVLENETGILFRAGSPEDLAEQVLWMLNHPQETKELINQAHKHVRALFDMEKISADYVKMVRTLAPGAT